MFFVHNATVHHKNEYIHFGLFYELSFIGNDESFYNHFQTALRICRIKGMIFLLDFQIYNKILKMLVETFLKKQFEQFTLNSRLIALVYQLSP